MLLLVYCCNIEIKLLHIVLVLQCIEDIVDSSKHFFALSLSAPQTCSMNVQCLHLHLDAYIPDT